MINNESRKVSFYRKIQGVKELINFDSISSEDPHLAEIKRMPMRMRTQILPKDKRRQFLQKANRNRSHHMENQIDEVSDSESVNTFSSSYFEDLYSMSKKSPSNKEA